MSLIWRIVDMSRRIGAALAASKASPQSSDPPPNKEAVKRIVYTPTGNTGGGLSRDRVNFAPIYFPKIYIERVILNTVFTNARTEDNDIPGEELPKIAAELLLSAKIPQQKQYLNFLKSSYVKINIIEVRSEKWKQLLQKSTEFIQKIVENEIKDIDVFFVQLAQKYGIIPNVSRQKLEQSFNRYCKIDTIENIPSIEKISRTNKLQSGETALDYYFKYNTKSMETDHLSFFVYADYDKEKILEEQSLANIKQENPQVSAEMIINKGKLCSLTYVFYDKNDVVWTGDIHERGLDGDEKGKGIWYKGRRAQYIQGETETLTRRAYYNTKIQDFRRIQRLSKIPDFLYALEKQKKLVNEYYTENMQNTTVYSKKTDTPVKFLEMGQSGPILQIPEDELLKKYSRIYNSLSEILSYGSDSIIQDIKAYKIRAKNIFPNGFTYPSIEKFLPFRENEQKQYIDATRMDNMRRETKKREIIIKITDPVFSLQEGEYCYGIELLIIDPLIDSLRKMVERLEISIENLQRYYITCKQENYYDFELNQFTEQFQSWYEGQKQKGVDLENIIADFSEATMLLLGEESEDSVADSIHALIHPVPGTPAGVLYFVNFANQILAILQNLYKNSQKEKYIRIEKLFDNITERRKKQVTTENEPNFNFNYASQQSLQQFQDLTSAVFVDQEGNPLLNGDHKISNNIVTRTEAINSKLKEQVRQDVPQRFDKLLTPTPKVPEPTRSFRRQEPVSKKIVETVIEAQKQKNADRRYQRESKGQNSSNIQVSYDSMRDAFRKGRRR